jgi:hypothetical protein
MVSSWAGRILPALVDGRKAARHDGIPPWEVLVVRFASALLLISWVALAGSEPEPASQSDGKSPFRAGQFKAAPEPAEALPASPNSVSLHFRAGRSYERPAAVASPVAAHKNVRQGHGERIAPQSPWNASVSPAAARQHAAARHEFEGAGRGIERGVMRLGALIGRLLPHK